MFETPSKKKNAFTDWRVLFVCIHVRGETKVAKFIRKNYGRREASGFDASSVAKSLNAQTLFLPSRLAR